MRSLAAWSCRCICSPSNASLATGQQHRPLGEGKLSTSKMDLPNKAKPSKGTGKKKHRKKKAKQTESKEVKLEKAGREFQRNASEYRPFLDRMDKWLKAHHQQAMQLFCKYDKVGNGLLQYDEFKLGMRDLKIPCVEVHLHILTRLLDPHNSGTIDYVELGTGLDKARHDGSSIEDEDHEDDEEGAVKGGDGGTREEDTASGEEGPSLVITKEELARCPCCHLGVWTPVRVSEARYISLSLRMVSFHSLKSHPGHFQRTVPAHTKVHGLIGQICDHTGIRSTSLGVYREPSTSPRSALPPQLSLEECGLTGGPHHAPTSAILYYDYSVEFSDCPILNCDHYINFRKL